MQQWSSAAAVLEKYWSTAGVHLQYWSAGPRILFQYTVGHLNRIFNDSSQPSRALDIPRNDQVSDADKTLVAVGDTPAQQAHQAWLKAKTAAEQGNWAEYGAEIERLGELLSQLKNITEAGDADIIEPTE